jgi:hypothetical protein
MPFSRRSSRRIRVGIGIGCIRGPVLNWMRIHVVWYTVVMAAMGDISTNCEYGVLVAREVRRLRTSNISLEFI